MKKISNLIDLKEICERNCGIYNFISVRTIFFYNPAFVKVRAQYFETTFWKTSFPRYCSFNHALKEMGVTLPFIDLPPTKFGPTLNGKNLTLRALFVPLRVFPIFEVFFSPKIK